MEGVRKKPSLHAFLFWIFFPAALLLICASALWAVSEDDAAQIWIADAGGILIARQTDGTVESGIPLAHDARAVAVDAQRSTLWVFSNQTVMGFAPDGAQKFSTKINPPNGQPAFLVLDVSDGSAWLAVHSQLYHIDESGHVLGQQRIPHPISGITLDRANSRLWLSYRGTIEVFSADGPAFTVDTQGAKNIRALDYDQRLGQIWLIADGSLRRYSADGALAHHQGNAWFGDVVHIAADQQGALWAADKRSLARIDQSGLIAFSLDPFAGSQPDAIVSLVADSADGSAWVASQRQVAHFAGDSTRILEFAPQTEDNKTRPINQLALETPSLAPRISILAPTNKSVLGTARPEIVLAIDGPEADPASFEFLLNGVALDFNCAQTPAGYSCAPSQNIADGEYLLTITVADSAGNRSRPAEASFTIDTVAPVIEVTSPQDGLLTNQTSVQIAGRISEPASFAINDIPKTLREDNSFSHGPFELEEGENLFRLRATDAAGNTGERDLHVTRDTIPPPAPEGGQIQAQQQSDGTVKVTGTAGSVEGSSTVTVVNTRTGERVTTVANADGSFSVSIAGENGDELQVYATDRAGNVGQASSVLVKGDPFSGPITLSVVSPGNGSTVSDDKVLVVVDVRAPLNTGVTVNDIPAAAIPAGDKLRYYATVPLTVGTNSLIVKAVTIDGKETTQTVNVGSTGPAAFSMAAYPDTAIGPQTVRFELTDQMGVGIQEVRYDFDSDGTPELVTTDPFEEVSTTFSGVGLRTVTASIIDATGMLRTQTVSVLLMDPEQLDGVIRAIWGGMNGALAAGEKGAAMRFLTETAKEKYGAVFDALMPRMAAIIDSYSVPQRSYLSASMAEYGVNRTVEGTNRVFLVGFVTNEYGQWQVDAM